MACCVLRFSNLTFSVCLYTVVMANPQEDFDSIVKFKRKRNEDKWTANKLKRWRAEGQEYTTKTGVLKQYNGFFNTIWFCEFRFPFTKNRCHQRTY